MEKTQIAYDDYYVAYVDVLGFSDLVSKSAENASYCDQIALFYDRTRKAFERFKTIRTKAPMYCVAMSDTLVLAMPARAVNDDAEESLRELCIAVGTIQWDMALHGLWMRGGIARGKCWIEQDYNQITGPAFLKAYQLEKCVAKYPRVVLDAELIPTLKHTNKAFFARELNRKRNSTSVTGNWTTDCVFDWSKAEQAGNLIREDYPLFVDYLSPTTIIDNEGSLETIIQKLEANIYREPGYEKLNWVANYLATHFKTSKALPEFFPLFERLKGL